MNENYRKGFADGYKAAYMEYVSGPQGFLTPTAGMTIQVPPEIEENFDFKPAKKPRRKVKRYRKPPQIPKQKLLTQMTKKKWDKYKKGKGKKTYVQIRAEVSRSQAFKKKAKRL